MQLRSTKWRQRSRESEGDRSPGSQLDASSERRESRHCCCVVRENGADIKLGCTRGEREKCCCLVVEKRGGREREMGGTLLQDCCVRVWCCCLHVWMAFILYTKRTVLCKALCRALWEHHFPYKNKFAPTNLRRFVLKVNMCWLHRHSYYRLL